MIKEPCWAQATCATWITAAVEGRQLRVDTVRGFCRPLHEADLGVSLVRDSRWALGFYENNTTQRPFFVMPGCQVRSLQLLAAPCDPGFIEWIEQEPTGRYEFASLFGAGVVAELPG